MNIAVAAQAHATVTGDKMSVDKEEGPSSPPKATTTNAAHGPGATDSGHAQGKAHEAGAPQVSFAQLPLPVTTGSVRRPGIFGRPTLRTAKSGQSYGTSRSRSSSIASARKGKYGFAEDEEVVLLPAAMPPASTLFDIFPFSLMIRFFESKGKDVQGKKAARQRAKSGVVTRNVPLEISMYLVSGLCCNFTRLIPIVVTPQTSYNSVLAARKWIETPTNSKQSPYNHHTMYHSTSRLSLFSFDDQYGESDARRSDRTGESQYDAHSLLVRTPFPSGIKVLNRFDGRYSIHLWIVTIIYCLAIVRDHRMHSGRPLTSFTASDGLGNASLGYDSRFGRHRAHLLEHSLKRHRQFLLSLELHLLRIPCCRRRNREYVVSLLPWLLLTPRFRSVRVRPERSRTYLSSDVLLMHINLLFVLGHGSLHARHNPKGTLSSYCDAAYGPCILGLPSGEQLSIRR